MPDGAWDPQEEWAALPVLQYRHRARPRRCPFVAPMLTARVGSQLQLFSLTSAVLQFLPAPDHETFGLLLAPARTWLSSFCDLMGDVRGTDGAVCPRTWPSERSGAMGGLETSGPCRDRAFGLWEGFAGEPGGVHQFEATARVLKVLLCLTVGGLWACLVWGLR